MKSTILKVLPFLLLCFAISARFYAVWCIITSGVCHGSVIHHYALSIISPIYSFALWAVLPTFVVIFIRREVFNTWFKFTVVWVIVVTLILANTPVYPEGGGYINMYTVTRSEWAAFYGKAFSVLSVIIIAWKYWRVRRQERGS